LRHYGRLHSFAGPIRTVRFEKHLVVLKDMLCEKGNGGILVADSGGPTDAARLGDHLASIAAENGWAGVVTNGAVRDAQILGTLGIGIMARGCCPRRAALDGVIVRDTPLSFGGARFVPGHWLYADDDGIVTSSTQA
jgi:regulator of ribonuclease activity A